MPNPRHTCHAIDCSAPCPPEWLFCTPHWRLLPKALRDDVYRAYIPGQCKNHALVSRFWLKAAAKAKAYVAVAEGVWDREKADQYLGRYDRYLNKR